MRGRLNRREEPVESVSLTLDSTGVINVRLRKRPEGLLFFRVAGHSSLVRFRESCYNF